MASEIAETMAPEWWRSAVIYQIYPRRFRNTTGNGVGGLGGVLAGFDHLERLGVDALWLSPIFVSPMVDLGDLDQLGQFVALAHVRDIEVLLSWVPHHTSEQHPGFVEFRSSKAAATRYWYMWREGSPDISPNN